MRSHTSSQFRKPAPVYDVPTERVVSVEHPSIIRNFEKGLKSLGGEPQLKHVLEYQVGDSRLSNKQAELPEPVAGVSLRPDDPFAKRFTSIGIETRNVLVRVTLPKRTGRKRKRGSDEPFTSQEGPQTQGSNPTAQELLHRLQESKNRYSFQPVSMLRETHRYRTLGDFQFRSSDIPIMSELRKHAMNPVYEELKEFYVDLESKLPDCTIFSAPPSFTNTDIPHKYEYQQAAGIVVVTDEFGRLVSQNTGAPQKRVSWGLPPDVIDIPQGPPPNLRQRSLYGEQLNVAITALEKLLAERPLVTKRVAINALPPIGESIFKEATQWVGYSFRAGPWRDSLIRYGVDPRTDPRYRVYQTLMFQVDKELASSTHVDSTASSHLPWMRTMRYKRDDPTTHIFDGKSITANGKTWQICDITDPVMVKVFESAEIRKECDAYQWGWYHNGTMAKARVIMKDKMRHLFAGEQPPEEDYVAIAAMPDRLTVGQMQDTVHPLKVYGPRVMILSTEVRSIAKTGEGQRLYKQEKSKTAGDADQELEKDGEDGDAGVDGDGEELNATELDVEDDDQGDFGEMDEEGDETGVGAEDDGIIDPT